MNRTMMKCAIVILSTLVSSAFAVPRGEPGRITVEPVRPQIKAPANPRQQNMNAIQQRTLYQMQTPAQKARSPVLQKPDPAGALSVPKAGGNTTVE